jgi:hypothetical protein
MGNRDNGPPFANQEKDPSFEVWSPPYLFRGDRPTITRAQAGIDYGERFAIGTPDPAEIDSVVLLALMSPEHDIDPDQRSLALAFTRAGDGTLEAVAPPSGNVAPPGRYYLVVNRKSDKGPIPSVARIVKVGLGTDPADALQPFADDSPAPVGPAANVDRDSSFATESRQRGTDAARQATSGIGAASTQVAPALTAVPASSERRGEPRLPGLPVVAVATAGGAAWRTRRWLRA